MGDIVHLPVLPPTPRVRGDCLPGGANSARPCPFNTCPHHMASPLASCVLDVADRGGATLEEVADIIGVSRERIRQIEFKIRRKLKTSRLKAFWTDD